MIHQATNRVKSGRGANGPTVDVVDLVQLVPPTLLRMAASTYVLDLVAPLRPPFFHACFSNIPGPRGPLWLGGARLEGIYPFGPLFQDMNVRAGSRRLPGQRARRLGDQRRVAGGAR